MEVIPLALNNSNSLCCRSGGRLGLQVWCPGRHHNRLGIEHSPTTAYHPQANGLVERFHRQLKDSMRARLATRDWPAHLPWVLLGLRSAPKEDHNISEAELLYGVPLALPGKLLETSEPPAASFLENLRWCPTSIPTRPITGLQPSPDPPKGLSSASFVFVRRGAPGPPLSPLYDSPYQVLASGPKFFTLQVGDRQDTVSVDRLKPCLATEVNPCFTSSSWPPSSSS